MQKIKVIHISHASVSVYMHGQKTLKQMILDDWYSLTAQQIKKYNPEIEIECWTPEKAFKTQQEFSYNGIKYRQFPTIFSPVYGLDLSTEMLGAIRQEINKTEKEGVKLILHLHEYHNLHGLFIATRFKDANIIAQHHGGSWPLKHVKQTKRYRLFFPFFFFGQIWENHVLRNIREFYVLSQEEINYLKKIAPKSVIKFQTMGIEEEFFKKENKKDARKKIKWNQEDKIVLYLGRLINQKGIGYLIDAMQSLPDVKLKVIGWGELDFFKKYADSKNLKNVEFLGPIFGEKKLVYLAAADALVLPSMKEGAPVTVMESLARNTPVVVTDIGGVPMMIENGKEGIIIKQKSSEEIVRGIKEILKWKKKNVQQSANKYKWKKIVEDTLNDYKTI